MCMKLALLIFIAVIAVGCAGSAARARETANRHRRAVAVYSDTVTDLGRLLGAHCNALVDASTPDDRVVVIRRCDRLWALYEGVRTSFKPVWLAIDVYEVALAITDDTGKEINQVMTKIMRLRQLTNDLGREIEALGRDADAIS